MYRFVLPVFVVCMALTACAGEATPDPTVIAQAVAATLTAQVSGTAPIAEELTYRNETHGIAFSYPSGWELTSENVEETVVEISKTEGKEKVGVAFFSLVQLDQMPLVRAEASLASFIDGMIALGGTEVAEQMGPRNVGGRDAVAVVIEKETAFLGVSFIVWEGASPPGNIPQCGFFHLNHISTILA